MKVGRNYDLPFPKMWRQKMSQDQVGIQLGAVIEEWVGAKPGSYGPGKWLSTLWIKKHGVAIPYSPDGVDRLLGHIHDNQLFQGCPQADSLQIPDFTNDGIKTVGQL